MHILINDKKKISDIQNEFNKVFPYLKIEFFSKPHQQGEPSHKRLMQDHTKTIGECRKLHVDGSVSVFPEMTVARLEREFCDMFGLSIQVFRKSGNVWLETTVTDNWSLEKQNTQGAELSNMPQESRYGKDRIDFDEN